MLSAMLTLISDGSRNGGTVRKNTEGNTVMVELDRWLFGEGFSRFLYGGGGGVDGGFGVCIVGNTCSFFNNFEG